MGLPDFLIIDAPKAGSTTPHDALALHPELYPAPVKEPKYFLCDDQCPDPTGQPDLSGQWLKSTVLSANGGGVVVWPGEFDPGSSVCVRVGRVLAR